MQIKNNHVEVVEFKKAMCNSAFEFFDMRHFEKRILENLRSFFYCQYRIFYFE